ncbi:hypothetical protein [Clostridium sp. 'White wine YQ']|uniref:hypothetical protein n=1 Tax=Clostridium sp. 'White wine YQ' TaxID=3027474 RepID=UPI002365B4D7|nr:hypothetical protein [Clostridium sp. 'White wine YQ']MDD7793405.1 hypothetical protein [Clostridium sp. 'White wine YQ']
MCITMMPSYEFDANEYKKSIDTMLKALKNVDRSPINSKFLVSKTDEINDEIKKNILSDSAMEKGLFESATGAKIVIGDEKSRTSYTYNLEIEENLTDPQFINNFVVVEDYYRDTIKAAYTGYELDEKLNILKCISRNVLEKLIDSYSNGIGNFFNGDLGWVHEDPSYKAQTKDNYELDFDIKEFKDYIIKIINKERRIFHNIKNNYKDNWQEIIHTYGKNINDFTYKLDVITSLKSKNSNKLEKMTYNDIKGIGRIINNIGNGIYTHSAKDLGAYLGQFKLKGDIMLTHYGLSSEVKSKLSDAIFENISNKIMNFSKKYGSLFDIPSIQLQKEVMNYYSSFATLSGVSRETFCHNYLMALNQLNDALLAQRPAMAGSAERSRFAEGAIQIHLSNWDKFIDKLDVEPSIKESYRISSAIERNINKVS